MSAAGRIITSELSEEVQSQSDNIVSELIEAVNKNTETTEELVIVVDKKMDKLIEIASGKGMIPVEVLKWIVIFMLVFTFITFFGVETSKMLIDKYRAVVPLP